MKAPTQWIRISGLALALTGVLAPATWAQRQPATPEARQESREDRQRRIEQMTPEQRQQYFQQRQEERLKTMTPEQRAQFEARRAQMEQMRRQDQLNSVSVNDRQRFLMNSAGVEDAAVQDAVFAFLVEQAQKRVPVTEAATQLSALLADKSSASDALSTQLQKLQAASKEFRAWREGALAALDTKIGYSKDSRLQSLLVLVGILGNESTDAGGFNAIFPKGLAGSGDIIDLLPKTDNANNFGGMGGGRMGGGGNRGGNQNAPADNAATAN
jgi:hypothetical protein